MIDIMVELLISVEHYKINKDVASDITSNMVPLLLFGGLVARGINA
jgi:hypothetical protein